MIAGVQLGSILEIVLFLIFLDYLLRYPQKMFLTHILLASV